MTQTVEVWIFRSYNVWLISIEKIFKLYKIISGSQVTLMNDVYTSLLNCDGFILNKHKYIWQCT